MKRKQTIFKIQVSLTSSDMPTVLAYNEDRSYMGEWSLDGDTKKIMKGRNKAYFRGIAIGSILMIDEEAPIQDW